MAITVLDMHIEVLQGLQKVDSYQQDMFEPEEIDFQLNKQQDRFVENLFNKDFEHEQIRLDYLSNLVVKNTRLLAYVNTEEINTNLTNQLKANQEGGQGVYAVLPSDYLHLVSDRSRVVTPQPGICDFSTYLGNLTTTFEESICVLPFPKAVLDPSTGTYFIDLEIVIDTNVVYKTRFNVDNSDLTQGSTITDPNYLSPIVRDILERINVDNIPGLGNTRIYWERYRNNYYPNSFVFVKDPKNAQDVSTVPFPAAFSITTKTSAGAPSESTSGTISSINYTTINRESINSNTQVAQQEVFQNKLAKADELYDLRKNIFYQPNSKEPHSTLSQERLFVYGSPSSIITDVVIDYIRKPRQISLSLNQSCELSGTASRLIVDSTVEYLKLVIENPNYQGILQDNQLRNQNY